jgi:tRNA threonylcarbamoyladenosine biosynthesis protein TsaE
MDGVYTTQNAQETQELGEKLAKTLQRGTVVALYGNLGFGKTTFTQGFATGLGITKRIISPTFVILRTYDIQHKNHSIQTFYHADLYRVENKQELIEIGLSEILQDEKNFILIEWAEKLGSLLPKKHINVTFSHALQNKRKITITSYA